MSRKNWTDEKLIFRLLNNKSEKAYSDNLCELRSRNNQELFVRSYKLAKSRIIKEKILGIDILSQLGSKQRPFYKETIKLYFELLTTETNTEIIVSILYGIGHNNYNLNSETLKLISAFRNHKDSDVRKAVVLALMCIENKIAINTLIQLSNDKVSSIRNWATFGIGTQVEQNNKEIRLALWNRVNDANVDTKYEAIIGLVNRNETRIKEIVKIELLTENYRSLLFEAIIKLNAIEFLPILNKQLRKEKSNKNIEPYWLEKLKDCISELKNNKL